MSKWWWMGKEREPKVWPVSAKNNAEEREREKERTVPRSNGRGEKHHHKRNTRRKEQNKAINKDWSHHHKTGSHHFVLQPEKNTHFMMKDGPTRSAEHQEEEKWINRVKPRWTSAYLECRTQQMIGRMKRKATVDDRWFRFMEKVDVSTNCRWSDESFALTRAQDSIDCAHSFPIWCEKHLVENKDALGIRRRWEGKCEEDGRMKFIFRTGIDGMHACVRACVYPIDVTIKQGDQKRERKQTERLSLGNWNRNDKRKIECPLLERIDRLKKSALEWLWLNVPNTATTCCKSMR